MISSPREDLTLTCDISDAWAALERELEMWRQDNVPATLWWRDDDAQEPSAQLDRLIRLSATSKTPLILATIPHGADDSLSEKIRNAAQISIVQHGWSHRNHAPPSEKKCELGDHRALSKIEHELVAGADILIRLFGDRFLPVLVPPWNRISNNVTDQLENYGYVGLSTFGDRKIVQVSSGLHQANTHVDLINWRGDRAFIGTKIALEKITSHLNQRRCRKLRRNEATGILTHHLDHDENLWQFLELLFQFTQRHSAAQWQTGREVFGII